MTLYSNNKVTPPFFSRHILEKNVRGAIYLSIIPLTKVEQIARWMNRLFLSRLLLLKIAAVCLLCGGAALYSVLFANERRECSPAHLTNTHTHTPKTLFPERMARCVHVHMCSHCVDNALWKYFTTHKSCPGVSLCVLNCFKWSTHEELERRKDGNILLNVTSVLRTQASPSNKPRWGLALPLCTSSLYVCSPIRMSPEGLALFIIAANSLLFG